MFSSIRSGSRVSSTCFGSRPAASGSSVSRSPRSMMYGKCDEPRRLVERADVDDLRVEDLLDLVADERRRSPAWSSSPAIASCTLLISASSAFRCRVSCTSRAFSSATLRLPASVVSRRTSLSENAFVRSKFWSEMRPRTSSAGDRAERRAPRAPARPRQHGIGSPRSPPGRGTSLIRTGALRLEQSLGRATDRAASARREKRTPRSIDVRVVRQPGVEVEDADVDDLGVEDLLDLVADDVVDRLHLELAGKRLLDAVDQRQLGVPLPRLVHQPRVLERHAQAAGKRRQQADVALGERVRPVEVLQRDPAASFSPEISGAMSTGLRRFAARHGIGSPLLAARSVGTSLIRTGALVSSTCDCGRVRAGTARREADASLDRVRVVRQPGGEVEDADVDDLGVEDLLDLVADDVVDRLQLELAGERLLDAVDQRELGVPLPRLVHQPRVLERDAQAARQRLQQLLVGLAERVLPVDVLERDDAARLPAGRAGRTEPTSAARRRARGCRTARLRPRGPR